MDYNHKNKCNMIISLEILYKNKYNKLNKNNNQMIRILINKKIVSFILDSLQILIQFLQTNNLLYLNLENQNHFLHQNLKIRIHLIMINNKIVIK